MTIWRHLALAKSGLREPVYGEALHMYTFPTAIPILLAGPTFRDALSLLPQVECEARRLFRIPLSDEFIKSSYCPQMIL
jgi:hypothetical protein